MAAGVAEVAAIAAPSAALIVGLLTYRRGSRNDRVTELEQMTRAALDTQTSIIGSLRAEVDRHAQAALRCREECHGLRNSLTRAHADIDALRSTVDRHEATIDNQQAELIGLRRQLGEWP